MSSKKVSIIRFLGAVNI